MSHQTLHDGHQFLRIFVTRFGFFALADDGFLYRSQIGQSQFCAYGFDVSNWVYFTRHMHDVVVVKATHHVHDGIGFTNIGQELVAQALAFAGASHQACDVHKFHNRGLDFLWVHNFGQLVHARIGYFNNAHIRFNGTKRVVCRFNTGFG